MTEIDEQVYYTFKDIEKEAKPEFKGRVNEMILSIGAAFEIDFSKIKGIHRKYNTSSYLFTEDEKDLILVLLRSAKHLPVAHGNTRRENVQCKALQLYQDKVLEQIERLPDQLKTEVKKYEVYEQAREIQGKLENIHSLTDKLEFLYYMSTAKSRLALLDKVEKQMDHWIQELFEEQKTLAESYAIHYHLNKGTESPNADQIKPIIKRYMKKKIDRIKEGVDPEIQMVDQLIGTLLKIRIKKRT